MYILNVYINIVCEGAVKEATKTNLTILFNEDSSIEETVKKYNIGSYISSLAQHNAREHILYIT